MTHPNVGGNGNGQQAERPALPELDEGATNPFDRASPINRLVDPSDVHDRSFVFPGLDGLPFRGSPPVIKEDDPPEKRPQIGMQLFVTVLELKRPEDLLYYQKVAQLVGNGVAQISFEERHWVEEDKNWKVLLRWMLYYQYMLSPDTTGV